MDMNILKSQSPETHKTYFFRSKKRYFHFTELVVKTVKLKTQMFQTEVINESEKAEKNFIGAKFLTN